MRAEAAGAGTLVVRLEAGPPPAALGPLAASPGGSFFHTPAWLAAVADIEPKLQPCLLGVWDASGVLHAALPFFERRRLNQQFWYGGAWGTYSGIVGDDARAVDMLRVRFFEMARDMALVRVHDFADSLAAPGGWLRIEEQCQVLDLPQDPEALFRDAFTSQNRNKIRKAEKLGVRVRCGNDATTLRRYAELYRESAQRWNVSRAIPDSLFRALVGADGVEVWLAEQEGEVVAGLLNFNCGGQIMNWGNASRRDSWGVSPNNLLHWRALEAACRAPAGPRLYNFGSSAGLPGVETFKAAFGARLRTHPHWERRAGWLTWLQRLRRR